VDYPQDSDCIRKGDIGLVICEQEWEGDYYWLVEWDGIDCGHDGVGRCGSTPPGTGWYVSESDLTVTECDDTDGDGVLDRNDNCVDAWNPDQLDYDGDGLGDACDADADGDGVADDVDNCLLLANPDQVDFDSDGLGDACDADADGDDVTDDVDNCLWLYNPDQEDFDGDGMGDACDEDDDNDGVLDTVDECPFTELGSLIDPQNGCSLAQLVPCDGPKGEDQPWKNHGKYVRSMKKASKHFARMDLISNKKRAKIVKDAARSKCGKK
jgi:hypothetical protein